jgi:cyclase
MAARGSSHFRLKSLADGVHAAVATAGGFGLCNAGIVDLGGETLVFDTMLTPTAGRDLARAAERLTGHRPGFAVNSHWHGDHIWGNSAFVGSHIVSSRKVRANILHRSRAQFESDRRAMRSEIPKIDRPGSEYAKRDREMVRGWFRGVVALPRTHRIIPPDLTFEDQIEIVGSRRRVQLITYGGGHSPSDVFAFLPEERILFAGDLAMRGLHPSVGDGRPDRWIAILRRMERLRPRTVVPGHGPPGPGSTLATTRTYLGDVQRIARASLLRGVAIEGLAQVPIPPRYRRWGFTMMFPGNLARAYRLIRARPQRPRARPGGRSA